MIKLQCGDSIEIMTTFLDDSFDLCLTDPPYNLGIDYGSYWNDNLSYEEYKDWSKQWFTEAKRISKCLIFTPGWNNLKMWLTEIEYPKGIMIWVVKNQCSHSNVGGNNMWEPILVYGKSAIQKNVFEYPMSVQRLHKEHRHPVPKQLLFFRDILRMTKKINTVIDPFLGSGTTAIACKLLGKDCVGIDINPNYIRDSQIKVDNAQSGNIHNYIKDEQIKFDDEQSEDIDDYIEDTQIKVEDTQRRSIDNWI